MGPESSVNNLNGIPNFGHGFVEEAKQEVAVEAEVVVEAPVVEEEVLSEEVTE